MKFLIVFLLVLASTPLRAQGLCASDGQRAPLRLLERFTNADCAECWSDKATPAASAAELAVDWLIPGSQGDDAPLSAAATRDALQRLQALQQPVPQRSVQFASTVARPARVNLRVAHGVALGGYVGASISAQALRKTPSGTGPWTAWLVLVESIPAGTEGTPVARNLVRNVLVTDWPAPDKPLQESRPLGVPEGANPQRLRVLGWVQDASGRVLAATQSRCRR
jgi:hypothetical protein